MNILFPVRDLHIELLGIMSLSSILKIAHHNVDVVEARYDRVKQRLRDNHDTILAYSTDSFDISYYLNLNRRIKEEFDVFSVFGGPHPTYYPEMIDAPGVDAVCIGEGDYAFLDLVNNLAEGKPITNIENWWIKQDGQIFRNPPRPLIKDLDNLPFVDRELFNKPYMNTIYLSTSRGCLFRCSYCLERGEFRRRSVDNVIEEIRQAKTKSQAEAVLFIDLTFNISLSWLRDFSAKYRKEIGLPFYCRIRPDLVTSESMKYLKEAGCFCVGMGIETANDYLRNEVLKRGMSKEQIISAVEIIKKEKIRLKTYNMIGIPFGSLENDLETLKLNIQCQPDYAEPYLFIIYKNIGIYNSLIKNQRTKVLEVFSKKNFYMVWELDSCAYDMHKIKNLYNLFSLMVSFSSLFFLIPFLIRLPLHPIYLFLNFVWKGYCYFFRLWGRCLIGRRAIIKIIKNYFNMLK